jgi:hypothetical protein
VLETKRHRKKPHSPEIKFAVEIYSKIQVLFFRPLSIFLKIEETISQGKEKCIKYK